MTTIDTRTLRDMADLLLCVAERPGTRRDLLKDWYGAEAFDTCLREGLLVEESPGGLLAVTEAALALALDCHS